MKLAWIGNLGNVGFNYVRLLNNNNVNAKLFLPRKHLREKRIGNPEYEYEGASGESFINAYYRDYLNYALNRAGILGPLSRHEKSIRDNFDIVQAQSCHEIAALRIKKAAGVPYVGLTTGADLSEIAFSKSPFSRLYREALQQASHLFIVNIDQFNTLQRLNLEIKSFSFLPFSINPDRFGELDNSIDGKIILYSIARLDWTSHNRASIKRNDIFFRGFAKYASQNKTNFFELRIADWGIDRAETRKLINELGIEKVVKFIPAVEKEIFYRNLSEANLVVDQFSLGATGLAVLESMAMSRPVIAYIDQRLAKQAFGTEMPVFNCSNEEEVCDCLENLTPESIRESSIRCRQWVLEHHSEQKIFKMLREVYRNILSA